MEVKLPPKEEYVLSAIVSEYAATMNPVGSNRVSALVPMSLSPATVRNIIRKLSERGFLTRVHTSSGSVPTPLGIRYYVENVLATKNLANRHKSDIASLLLSDFADTYNLFIQMGELLSELARQIGVIIIASSEELRLYRIEVIPLSSGALSLVLMFDNGHTKNAIFRTDSHIPSERLVRFVAILNERLTGLTLTEIRESIDERLNDMGNIRDRFIEGFTNYLIRQAWDIFSPPKNDETLILGKTPEIISSLSVWEAALSGSALIKNAISDHCENKTPSGITLHFDETGMLSLVTASFSSSSGRSLVGFVGQGHLPYERIVPLLSYTSCALASYFTRGSKPIVQDSEDG
jgi:heat-inducible transcriptional repressor